MSIRARSSEILPFTLTETFVLLVFLLLLLRDEQQEHVPPGGTYTLY